MELIPLTGYEKSTIKGGNGSLPGILLNSRLSWGLIPYTENSHKGWVERTEFRRGTTLSGQVISHRRVGRCYTTLVGDSTMTLLLTRQTAFIPKSRWTRYQTVKVPNWVSGKPKLTQEFYIYNLESTGYATWKEIGRNLKPGESPNSIWISTVPTIH